MDIAGVVEEKLDTNTGTKAIKQKPTVQKKEEKVPAKVIRAQESSDKKWKVRTMRKEGRGRGKWT